MPADVLERALLEQLDTETVELSEVPRFGTVAFEAERLDRLFPGWYRNIDVSTLNMGDPYNCILGQGVPHMPYCEAGEIVEKDAGFNDFESKRDQTYTSLIKNYVWDRFIPVWTVEIERRLLS